METALSEKADLEASCTAGGLCGFDEKKCKCEKKGPARELDAGTPGKLGNYILQAYLQVRLARAQDALGELQRAHAALGAEHARPLPNRGGESITV